MMDEQYARLIGNEIEYNHYLTSINFHINIGN
jgi:hypothetical protein